MNKELDENGTFMVAQQIIQPRLSYVTIKLNTCSV